MDEGEFQALGGPSDLEAAAVSDLALLESWLNVGFTRREAFELLLTIKRNRHTVYIVQEEE